MSIAIDKQWRKYNVEHPDARVTRDQFRTSRSPARTLAHDKVMNRLENMSSTELRQSMVDAGIYTHDGKLTEHYRTEDKKLIKLFIIPDTHVPYHSLSAFSLALRAREAFKPDHTIIQGDFADCMAVSFHDKELERRQDFAWEVEQVNKALDRITDLGDKKHYVMGNHEARLQRYLAQKAPELYRLLSVEDLFKLKERGYSVTPYGQSMQIGRLWFTHDEGNAGWMAAAKARDTFQSNVAIGHVHIPTVSYQGNAKGGCNVGASFGWLGDIDTISYMHRVRAQKWCHGIGIAYVEPDSGNVHLQAVPIVDGKVLIEGRLIT